MDAYYLRAGYNHVPHAGRGSHSRFIEHRVSGTAHIVRVVVHHCKIGGPHVRIGVNNGCPILTSRYDVEYAD
jgi:hypothetical protein